MLRREGFLLGPYLRYACSGTGGIDRLVGLREISEITGQEILARLIPPIELIVYEQRDGFIPRQIKSNPRDASRLLAEGHCVTIEDGEAVFPILRDWKNRFQLELGLIGPVAPASIIISPPGSRVPIHHDGVELVVIQLAGEKLWWYCSPSSDYNADYTYFPSERGPGPRGGTRPQHRLMADHPPPNENGTELVMSPGDCLFLPFGWWHETEALGNSINLVFRLQAKPAYWLAANAIAEALKEHSHWRTPIPGLNGGEGLRLLAMKSLIDLAPRLIHDLNLTDIASPQALLRHLSGAEFRHLEGQSGRDLMELAQTDCNSPGDGLGLAPAALEAGLEWISARTRAFTESDFYSATGIDIENGSSLLRNLVNAKVLSASGPLHFI
nr:cupin domain-containing protein [Bosea vaviloviae]